MSASTVFILVTLLVMAELGRRRGAWGMALMCAGASLLPAITLIKQIGWPLLLGAAVLIAGLVWHRWSRTAATVTRWGARTRRKSGVASSLDIARTASASAMRRKARVVRPSTSDMSRWQRWQLPSDEFAVQLCKVGPQRVYASIEDVTVAFGGPRTGKTQWLAGRVLDAPGAVLVTSTRTDLLEQTGPLRAGKGPVFVFNPVGLAGLPSTITFDPLTGCADPVTAAERAADMLAATSHRGAGAAGGEREFWESQGRRVLAALMHAAALGGLSMVDVQRWIATPEASHRDVAGFLRTSPEPAFEQDAIQFMTTNPRTQTSITSTIMPALGWLTSPTARAAAAGNQPFDVARLLASRAAVYLLGGEEAQVAPLVCALTGYIAREARRLAANCPGGRLDPPLTLALDEAALICPVPLHRWSADMGGRGVTIIVVLQSRAQLLSRYGSDDSATLLNNAGAKILFGGTGDRDDLTYWSTLSGDRDEPILTTDMHGRVASRTVRRVPVLSPAQLANLPAGKVVVFRRAMAPVIGRAEMAYRRRDIRARARAIARIERSVRWRLRGERCRAWFDAALERVLVMLACRWPDRFGEAAARVRDANAMFRQVHLIQRDAARVVVAGELTAGESAGDDPRRSS